MNLGRIFLETRHGFYLDVVVEPDIAALERYRLTQPGADALPLGTQAIGLFIPVRDGEGDRRPRKCLGRVAFAQDHLNHGVIAHEMLHATLALLRVKYPAELALIAQRPTSPELVAAEERLTGLTGGLCDAFWRLWQRR